MLSNWNSVWVALFLVKSQSKCWWHNSAGEIHILVKQCSTCRLNMVKPGTCFFHILGTIIPFDYIRLIFFRGVGIPPTSPFVAFVKSSVFGLWFATKPRLSHFEARLNIGGMATRRLFLFVERWWRVNRSQHWMMVTACYCKMEVS